jgi:mannosyltransferase OCH1-like enzyme
MAIPKIIHYCWFGRNEKDPLILRCIQSWKKYCPDWEIMEWTEDTYDLLLAPKYAKDALAAKKWAFVSDYVRLDVINKMGGVYLDTDMEIVRDITPLLSHTAFMGFEDATHINNAMMGAVPHHPFVIDALKWYDEDHPRTPTPIVMNELFLKKIAPHSLEEKEQDIDGVHIYKRIAFYPYSKENIKDFSYKNLTEETYSVHWWNYSWGNPINKFFKKIGIYTFGKKLTEKLGIKMIIKKVLKFD